MRAGTRGFRGGVGRCHAGSPPVGIQRADQTGLPGMHRSIHVAAALVTSSCRHATPRPTRLCANSPPAPPTSSATCTATTPGRSATPAWHGCRWVGGWVGWGWVGWLGLGGWVGQACTAEMGREGSVQQSTTLVGSRCPLPKHPTWAGLPSRPAPGAWPRLLGRRVLPAAEPRPQVSGCKGARAAPTRASQPSCCGPPSAAATLPRSNACSRPCPPTHPTTHPSTHPRRHYTTKEELWSHFLRGGAYEGRGFRFNCPYEP